MTREGRILELGTFTAYATACLLEGAANVAQLLSPSSGQTVEGSQTGGPYVLSLERDTKAFDVAVEHMKVIAKHGFGEDAAERLCAVRSNAVTDKTGINRASSQTTSSADDGLVSLKYRIPNNDGGYSVTGCELFRVSDALAVVEEIAAGLGSSLLRPAPFDMVFVDADKTRLVEYVDSFLSSDRLLKKGGIIVVDNVLWKGLVLEASGGIDASGIEESGLVGSFGQDKSVDCGDEYDGVNQLRKNRRARKLANKMHRFNDEIVKDDRAEVLVLPIRDGLSVIRKK